MNNDLTACFNSSLEFSKSLETEVAQHSPVEQVESSKSAIYDRNQESEQAKRVLVERIASAVKEAIGNSTPTAQIQFYDHIPSLATFIELNREELCSFVERMNTSQSSSKETGGVDIVVKAAVFAIKQFGIQGKGGGSIPFGGGKIPEFRIPVCIAV